MNYGDSEGLYKRIAALTAENARLRDDIARLLLTFNHDAIAKQVDALTAENVRLTDEMAKLEMVKFWEGITRLRNFFRLAEYTPPANIVLEAIEVLERLTAENARLRGEVEKLEQRVHGQSDEITGLRGQLADYGDKEEQVAALTADLERARANALLHASHNVALETDLARVTAERDGLLFERHLRFAASESAARDAAAECGRLRERIDAVREQMPRGESCFACRGALSVLAACAPPASGGTGGQK